MQEQFPEIYLYRRIVQAKLFIDHNFGEKIELRGIADEACFSKFHFIRLFKMAYGKTPHQYLTAVRINKAQLLLQDDVSVTETCFIVGFESLTSFVGLFKRLTGISPSAYRQQQRERKNAICNTPLNFIPNCFAAQNGWTGNSNFEEAV
jgi:AraC-like DNA-binding protein